MLYRLLFGNYKIGSVTFNSILALNSLIRFITNEEMDKSAAFRAHKKKFKTEDFYVVQNFRKFISGEQFI